MRIWFFEDVQRLELERTQLEALGRSMQWLKATSWGIDNGLHIDATIQAHGHDYHIRLTYPNIFPYAPPTVCPQLFEEKWSTHQYPDGTLCLEWGSDNWQPNISGAQVLESAYNLLHTENPLGSQNEIIAPSRHKLSLGQELRNKYSRFYIGKELAEYLLDLPNDAEGTLKFSIVHQSDSWLVIVEQIQLDESLSYEDASIPKGVRGSSEKPRKGLFSTTRLINTDFDNIEQIKEALHQTTGTQNCLSEIDSDENISGLILIDSNEKIHFFFLPVVDEGKILPFYPVISDNNQVVSRLPFDQQNLSDKSVAIVGLGSIGSRVALSLARMGVSKFLLVDEDVFLPENVCRHSLDWNNIGEHKVNAVAHKLSLISANIEVDVSKLHLVGQESTSSFSAILSRLAHYDLIINATADKKVFNLTTAIATSYSRHLIWAEVFTGGFGGIVARSRPEQDPEPHLMKAAYHEYTSANPVPKLAITENYTAFDTEQERVLSASDADVGVIANHTARFAIDTLLENETSTFPYSMYLIGLSKAWVFKAPFHTIPIDTSNLPVSQKTEPPSQELVSEHFAFLENLIKDKQ